MIQSIKNIIARIYQDTGVRIIKANTNAPTPPYPYGIYNITSPYTKGIGGEDIEPYEDETGFYLKRSEQHQATLSFNFYTATDDETIELSTRIRRWFVFVGQDFIQQQNIAVIEVTNIEDRTTFIVDSYEYKYGFDVRLRLTEEDKKAVDYYE